MLSRKQIFIFIQGNKNRFLKMFILGCLPALLCILYCKAYGGSLRDVFLPTSYWNDELFYYKQVEGVISGKGYPLGYFGFNESHARLLSFGAWNPLLFLPWVIWGILFGWNLYSPVLCNLFCITVSIMIFAWLVKPGYRQTVSIVLMLSVFTPFTRFILSSVVETFCCSALLVYAGLFMAYGEKRKNSHFIIMVSLIFLLTISRPYYFLLALLMAISFPDSGAKRQLILAGGGLLGLLGYFFIARWFTADYLSGLIGNDFFGKVIKDDFVAGIGAFGTQIGEMLRGLYRFLKDAVRYGRQQGCMYGVLGLLGGTFSVIFLKEKGKNIQWARIALGIVVVYTFMMAAIMFMYNISDGDRHLLAFIILGILFLGMYQTRIWSIILKAFIILPLVFLFCIKPGTDYDRQVPFVDQVLQQELMDLRDELGRRMELSKELSWDNTVIWLAYDMVDGENVAEQWQQLYALPSGFGINHCSPNYILDNFENINSRYIAAVPGGEVEKKLRESGASFVAGNENIAIWDRK